MIDPTGNDIGREVLNRKLGEKGIIASFDDTCVFVRYYEKGFIAATNRSDLEWVSIEGCENTNTRISD